MKVTWRSPSNIALIKYWGKYGRQLPRNASISFTLQNAYTETSLDWNDKEDDGKIELEFEFEGREMPNFCQKIKTYLAGITDRLPFLTAYKLNISSWNSFPHSAGIASSASSMSALALCLCSMDESLNGKISEESFYHKASDIARLGSGSASRSVFSQMALWGETKLDLNASNEFAIPYGDKVHEVFHGFHDDILMVSKSEKSVSSTAGHALMDSNPFSELRYKQAHNNLQRLLLALKSGDLKTFGQIVEQEALQLHALMMTSTPSYILMEGNTIELIKRLQAWRQMSGVPMFFTLDAGPNLHLLYPHSVKNEAKKFIERELVAFCERGEYLEDMVGLGPIKVT